MPSVAPIQIDSGPVRGIPSEFDHSIIVFKGIPFAAPTGGDNRWRPPQPPQPWLDIRVCDQYGPMCPQIPFGPVEKLNGTSEDCLSLNVFSPLTQPKGDEGLAVYVWIYGGRFIAGSGSQPAFDGAGLAKKGIIVVTLNYRVGILGFLAHPELDAESPHGSSGNYGILDQIAALQWVQDNIAVFGGDPSKVTIGGQSAGGASTGIHVMSPLSKGLFRAAAPQAGKRYTHDPLLRCLAPAYRDKAKALQMGIDTVKEKGATSIAELRNADIDLLLVGNNKNEEDWGNPPFYRPCIDGYVLPTTYTGIYEQGLHNDVPILTGHNSDEGGTYADPGFTYEDFVSCVEQKYGDLADRFHQVYPAKTDAEAQAVWNDAARDHSRVTVAMWRDQYGIHAKSPVWGYQFNKAPPPKVGGPDGPRGKQKKAETNGAPEPEKKLIRIYESDVPRSTYTYSKATTGSRFGAWHGAEIPYVFNNLYAQEEFEWEEVDHQVAETTSTYWVNFIKHSDPNGDGSSGLPEFPQCDDKRIMKLGEVNEEVPLAATEEKVQFLRDFLTSQKAW